jgi:predicted Zn-dependent protease with MMP-like domain
MPDDRALFDRCFRRALGGLPGHVRRVIDEDVPIVVLDAPTPEMMADLGLDPSDPGSLTSILGLHTGVALTESSIEDGPVLPPVVHLFRLALLEHATDESGRVDPETLEDEIRTTLLHELGHHFGLDEDDLENLGYD